MNLPRFPRRWAVALTLSACARPPTAPPATPRPVTATNPPSAPTPATVPQTVALLQPGAAPRMKLRYTPQAERPESVVIETSSRVRIGAGQAKVPDVQGPTLRLTLELQATRAQPRPEVQGRVQRVEVLQAPGASAAIATAVRNDLEPVAGTKLQIRLDDRGLATEVQLEDPPTTNPQLEHLLASLRRTLAGLWPALPEEEVGRGGSWQVTRVVSVAAAQVQETLRYTVTDLSGGRVRMTVTVAQSAAEQNISPAGLPAGTRLALKQLLGAGEGKGELTLNRLVQPLELRWASQGDGTVDTPDEPAGKLEISTSEQLIVRRGKP